MASGVVVEADRPTLDEIRKWPATVSVTRAALALGISRAHAYACIRTGEFPARALTVGSRIVVSTRSILDVIEGSPVRETA